MMGKFVNEYKNVLRIKEMGLKDGCFVSSFYPPEENWLIEKCYTDR